MDTPSILLEAFLPDQGVRNWSSASHMRIGRIPVLEIVLNEDSISRRHAEVFLADEGWVVRDLGSSNGTFLNGVRVGRTAQKIRLGDALRTGRIEFRVVAIRESAATPSPVGLRSELKKNTRPKVR